MNTADSPVGLVGVGLLGAALAERLLEEGFCVVGFDTDPKALAAIRNRAFFPADSLEEVAERCRRIVLCLPNSEIVAGVVEGPSGLATGAAPATTLIDTTTGDPSSSRALADRLSEKNVAYLDATVVGSSAQLRQRDVTLLAGAEPETFESCADIFHAWTDRVFHMGPVGSGATAKLLCNQVLGLNRLVLAEALVLAEKVDVNPTKLLEILKTTVAYSCVMDNKGPKMISGDFTPEARLAQHRKDVGLILQMAEGAGAKTPVSRLHAKLLDAAIAGGYGSLDNSAIVRVFRGENTTE